MQSEQEKQTKEQLAEELMKKMSKYNDAECAKAFGLIYLADALHKLVDVFKERFDGRHTTMP